jgi:hypothetical protein
MLLLQTCPVPQPEYVCLSVLMDDSTIDVETFVELTTIVSPLSTTSPIHTRNSLQELHQSLSAQLESINEDDEIIDQKSLGVNSNSKTAVSSALHLQHQQIMKGLAEDSKNDETVEPIDNDGLQSSHASTADTRLQALCIAENRRYQQKRNATKDSNVLKSFTTRSGMNVEYIFIRDVKLAQKCISSFHAIANVGSFMNLPIHGIVIALGVTGSPHSAMFLPQTQSLHKRMMEFSSALRSIKLCSNKELQQKQKVDLEIMLLSILMDDESLKTNAQFDAEYGNFADNEEQTELDIKASKPKLSRKKFSFKDKKRRRRKDEGEDVSKNVASTALISSSAPSSEVARIISDQMQVLAISEKNMNLVGYKNAAKMYATGKTERVSGYMKSPSRVSRRLGKDLVGFDFEPSSANSFNPVPFESQSIYGSSSYASDATSVTVTSMSTDSSVTSYIPTLSGPSRDSSNNKRQLRRNKVIAASVSSQQSKSWSQALATRRTGQLQQESTQGKFDPFWSNADESINEDSGKSAKNGSRLHPNGFQNPISSGSPQGGSSSTTGQKGNTKEIDTAKTPPKSHYMPGSRKLFTTIALNEDLACTYRGSKLTACLVQGIVQLQMRSQSTAFVPFVVRVFDAEEHIETVEENVQFANDLSSERHPRDEWAHKFIVTLPKADTYYPILKYTCSNKLVPVPLVSKR